MSGAVLDPSEVDQRREAIRRLPPRTDGSGNPVPLLNGIDFVEALEGAPVRLEVRFLRPLNSELAKANFRIEGGVRILGLKVVSVTPQPAKGAETLTLEIDAAGDRSAYLLKIVEAPAEAMIDRRLAAASVMFHPTCAGDFDCKEPPAERAHPGPDPDIDYLARDYAALRRLLLDRMSSRMPGWSERNPADVGVMLAETLAYVGDQLAYRQDAISTEAYLSTARLATSVRRHARLMDYHVHDGHSALTLVQFVMAEGAAPQAIGPGAVLLTATQGEPPVIGLDRWSALGREPAPGGVAFETRGSATLQPENNRFDLHAWGAEEADLAAGATSATLLGAVTTLSVGDLLVFAQARGSRTGDPADADPAIRHAVRLTEIAAPSVDPLDGRAVTDVAWGREDALPWPLTIASVTLDGIAVPDVAVAWGNCVLADHGLTRSEDLGAPEAGRRFRPELRHGPLAFATPDPPPPAPGAPPHSARRLLLADVAAALPAIRLTSSAPPADWTPVRTLLDQANDERAAVFVVEQEPDGAARLRFGDGRHGAVPPAGAAFSATYRTGGGRSGAVAPGGLQHVVHPTLSGVAKVWNPIPALGGEDPEQIETARRRIPYAYRTQQRAVTPADYAAVANAVPGVQRAAARLLWTGSWHAVSVVIDAEGGALSAELEDAIRAALEIKRMACHPVEVTQARLIPLDVAMFVCLKPGYLEGQVTPTLLALFTGVDRASAPRGLFHPDRVLMGERFYLSPLIAAAQAVDGVAHVEVTRFARQDVPGGRGLADGYLEPASIEAFVLANDPNFPEQGRFELTVREAAA